MKWCLHGYTFFANAESSSGSMHLDMTSGSMHLDIANLVLYYLSHGYGEDGYITPSPYQQLFTSMVEGCRKQYLGRTSFEPYQHRVDMNLD